jgi:hypothetical protein
MSLDRREFITTSMIGLGGYYVGRGIHSPWPANQQAPPPVVPEFQVRIRGLCLLERGPGTLTVHVVDAAKLKLDLPPHRAVLMVNNRALDKPNTAPRDDVIDPNQPSTETWIWDLAGKQVSILDQAGTSDHALDFDTSDIPQPLPPDNVPMSSTKWIPDLRRITGATKRIRDDAFNCRILLNRGRIEGAEPTSRSWRYVVWTFRNKNGGQIVQAQAMTDLVLYRSALNGPQKRVITIGSAVVTLNGDHPEQVTIQNLPVEHTPLPENAPFTLGHFPYLYGLVDKSIDTVATAEPPSKDKCEKCDILPIFCPPAMI